MKPESEVMKKTWAKVLKFICIYWNNLRSTSIFFIIKLNIFIIESSDFFFCFQYFVIFSFANVNNKILYKYKSNNNNNIWIWNCKFSIMQKVKKQIFACFFLYFFHIPKRNISFLQRPWLTFEEINIFQRIFHKKIEYFDFTLLFFSRKNIKMRFSIQKLNDFQMKKNDRFSLKFIDKFANRFTFWSHFINFSRIWTFLFFFGIPWDCWDLKKLFVCQSSSHRFLLMISFILFLENWHKGIFLLLIQCWNLIDGSGIQSFLFLKERYISTDRKQLEFKTILWTLTFISFSLSVHNISLFFLCEC